MIMFKREGIMDALSSENSISRHCYKTYRSLVIKDREQQRDYYKIGGHFFLKKKGIVKKGNCTNNCQYRLI